MLKESVKYEFGCIMAIPDKNASKMIVDLNKKLIQDEILYHEEGEEYGREIEPHITIKFGLTKDYTKEDMGKVISHIKPFSVKILGINVFENEKFDVIKFDIESEYLNRLNKMFSKLPNQDEYPIYHPHMTLVYVKKGIGKQFVKTIKPIEIQINKIKYSNPIEKYFYNLN